MFGPIADRQLWAADLQERIFKLGWASCGLALGNIDGVPTDCAVREIYRSVKARAKESSIGRARYSKKVRSSVLMNASTGIPG